MLSALFDAITLIFSFGLLYRLKVKNLPLSVRILISLGLGIVYSFLLKSIPANVLLTFITDSLYFIGNGYLALLKMLVIPLVLISILHTILNVGANDTNDFKKISFFTCGLLLTLTGIASLIGILIGKLFAVGTGLSLPHFILTQKHTYTKLADTFLGMLPANPVAMMVQENTIAIVFFAVLFGIAARKADKIDHEKIHLFKKLIETLFAIIKQLTALILELTPYGVFALIALLLINQGVTALLGMLNFIVAMYTAMALMLVIHSFILFIFGINPWTYFKSAFTPLFIAFTTRSSFGTLPVTENTLNQKFKINQAIATFVPSIGATVGMNACAGIFPAMLVVMTTTILHQPLTWDLILTVAFINVVASLGISGIPGNAYIAATITLTTLHLPYAILGLVQGVDPIVDMGRTATNVNGVMTTALVLDRALAKPQEEESYNLEVKTSTASHLE